MNEMLELITNHGRAVYWLARDFLLAAISTTDRTMGDSARVFVEAFGMTALVGGLAIRYYCQRVREAAGYQERETILEEELNRARENR